MAVCNNPHKEVLSWFTTRKKFKGSMDYSAENYFYFALISNKETEILQWFLDEVNVDLEIRDDNDNTLLHMTGRDGSHYENVQWLIDHGLDPKTKNKQGKTASYYIRRNKNFKAQG